MSYFQVHNHLQLLTTGTDDVEGSSVPVVSRWLWPGNMICGLWFFWAVTICFIVLQNSVKDISTPDLCQGNLRVICVIYHHLMAWALALVHQVLLKFALEILTLKSALSELKPIPQSTINNAPNSVWAYVIATSYKSVEASLGLY